MHIESYSELRNSYYSLFLFFVCSRPFRRSENTSFSSVIIVLQLIPQISNDVSLVFPALHAGSYFCLGVDLNILDNQIFRGMFSKAVLHA